MNLSNLYSQQYYNTDKNTVHSYIDHFYSKLFEDKKESAKNILEIGVYAGGSILLWKDYFTNAEIDCVDITNYSSFVKDDRINFTQGNAYDINFLSKLKTYDIIIDDGPHSLESMIFFAKNYTNLLKNNGIAIIEDVQSESWFDIIISFLPSGYTAEKIDLRNVKNRYDDLLLLIRKN